MIPDALLVPYFARLTDYLGAWCLEPSVAEGMFRFARDLDFKAHFAEPTKELMSVAEKVPVGGDKSVSVIRLNGVLMKGAPSMGGTSTVMARRDIRAAVADPDVSGILLEIDSPGGSVAGTADLAADVKAARKSKPVFAHISDLGASAAYWIASAADKITANTSTALIGSIGVVQVIHDYSAAAEKEGVRTLVFRTGPLKGLGTPGDKITEEQANHVQGLVDAVMQDFAAVVRSGRSLSAKEFADVSHGGVMTAPAALAARLIDGIQSASKTLNELAAMAKGANQPSRGRSATTLPMLKQELPTLVR